MYILLQQQKSISTDWDQPLSAEDWVRETERYINIIHRVSVHVKTTIFVCVYVGLLHLMLMLVILLEVVWEVVFLFTVWVGICVMCMCMCLCCHAHIVSDMSTQMLL